MEGLKELVRECIDIKKGEFQKGDSVRIVSLKYFVVLENGEIKQSDFDPILNNPGIKYAFIFPKVSNTPMSNWYYSCLKPIIVNQDFEVIEGRLTINDWIFEFHGQSLGNTPFPMSVFIINNKFGFKERNHFDIDEFGEVYKFLISFLNCSSNAEAMYLFEIHKKDKHIDYLSAKVNSLEADLYFKDLAIEGYKELLNSIKNLVSIKQ